MSTKISPFQLSQAAAWVQHEVLDPWINECETLLAADHRRSSPARTERRADLEVLRRLTKVCQRLIEKEHAA